MNELDRLFFNTFFHGDSQAKYPPYNIIKSGNDYILEFGVAGFTRDELSVEYDGKLIVVSGAKKDIKENVQYVHRGLSARDFKQSVAVRGQFEIGDVWFEDGVLTVEMKDKTERIIPVIKTGKDLQVKASKQELLQE